MNGGERFAWLPYACAVASLVVATMLCDYFDRFLVEGHLYYLWFIVAILFTAWFGGVKPSFFAYILSLPLIAFYFAPPRYDFRVEGMANQIGFVTFCVVGLALLFYGSRLAEGRRFRAELERRIEQQLSGRRELERQILEIASLEQRRIGQELHDAAGQELTALGLLADSLQESGRLGSQLNASTVEHMVQGIKRLQNQIRGISRGLVPVEIHADGLRPALAELAQHVGEAAGVDCTSSWVEPVVVSSDLTATHLFHIAQEACTNAVKHGQAKHVKISVCAANNRLVLQVADDGIGITAEDLRKTGGLGRHIMQNRAGVIQAKLSIVAAAPRGTMVTCTLIEELEHDRGA